MSIGTAVYHSTINQSITQRSMSQVRPGAVGAALPDAPAARRRGVPNLIDDIATVVPPTGFTYLQSFN